MTDWQEYRVIMTRQAEKELKDLCKKVGGGAAKQLRNAILDLSSDPVSKTQKLRAGLSDYRSLHVGRCRVLVRIEESSVTVYVVGSGERKKGDRVDVYETFKRALKDGKIDGLDEII